MSEGEEDKLLIAPSLPDPPANPADRPVVSLDEMLGDTSSRRSSRQAKPNRKPDKKKPAGKVRPPAASQAPKASTNDQPAVIRFDEEQDGPENDAVKPPPRMPASFQVFFIFAVAGFAVIIFPQSMGFSPILKFVSAIVLVGLFGLLGLHFRWYEPDRGGQRYIDNVYFLGFLYTQVALVAGFVELWLFSKPDASGVTRITSDQLIPIIAAALGASAVGLFLKVWLDEIYETKVVSVSGADEEKYRRKLGDLSKELADDVESVTAQFKQLSTSIGDTARAMVTSLESANTTASAVTLHGAKVATAVENLGPALAAFHTNLIDAGDQAARGIFEVKDDLVSATQSLKQIAGSARATEGIVTQLGDVVQTASDASGVFRKSADDLRSGAQARIDALARELSAIAKTTSDDSRTRFSDSIDRLEQDLNATRDRLTELVRSFSEDLRQIRSRDGG